MPTDLANNGPGCLALTGATGFIGQHILDMALESGWNVRALTRRDTSPRKGVTWVPGTLENTESLQKLISETDAVLHVAGATRARSRTAFLQANRGSTENLLRACETVMENSATTPHFIYLSSLAARHPDLSDYADSKAQAEQTVQRQKGFPCTLVRPPAVYGPGDREILRLFRFWARGIAPVFSKDARLSLIHVSDLSRCLLALAGREQSFGKTYEVSDGHKGGYAMSEVAETASGVLGRTVRPVRLPEFVLHLMGLGGTIFAPFLSRAPMVTRKKVREMLHPDWVTRDFAAPPAGLWRPAVSLPDGLQETLDWYRRHNLL